MTGERKSGELGPGTAICRSRVAARPDAGSLPAFAGARYVVGRPVKSSQRRASKS